MHFFLYVTSKLGSVGVKVCMHACLACEILGAFLVLQGVLNMPLSEIPHWWVQLPNQRFKHFNLQSAGCALSYGPLFSAASAAPWLALSISITLLPPCLEKVLSSPIQNIARARFPSLKRCHAVVGGCLELGVFPGLRLIDVTFWPSSQACCTWRILTELPVELHKAGSWRDSLKYIGPSAEKGP